MNNETEMEQLRNMVKELEEKQVKLEGELLKYYGLKVQELNIAELKKLLKTKKVEIDVLKITINSLNTERKKLQEEITEGVLAKKRLEIARNKIKELQRQIQNDANLKKGQLLIIKQQVSVFQAEEDFKTDAEVENKLKAVKDLELEVVELKRRNKELQLEKRILTIKMVVAEARITALNNMIERKMVAKMMAEANSLRHVNEELSKQVERLQKNRFSVVEELVYQHWVNACLMYEIQNYQTPSGKTITHNPSKSLSPISMERTKKLMSETDLDSVRSQSSSTESKDFKNTIIHNSSTSRHSSISKKPSLIQRLKKWGRSKDDSNIVSSTDRSFEEGSLSRTSMRRRSYTSTGPLEASTRRNIRDRVTMITFGNENCIDSPETSSFPCRRRRVSFNDSLNTVAKSFQKLKSKEARAERFDDSSNLNSTSKTKVDGSSDLGEQHSDSMSMVDTQLVSKIKLAHIEESVSRIPRSPTNSSNKVDTQVVYFVAVFVVFLILIYFFVY